MSKFNLDVEMNQVLNSPDFQKPFTSLKKSASLSNGVIPVFEKIAKITHALEEKQFNSTVKLLKASLEAIKEENNDLDLELISQRFNLGQ